jgi:acetyl-CoA carboxylase biotin carboxyl carrier protein
VADLPTAALPDPPEEELQALLRLVAGTDVEELEVEVAGTRIVLRREPGAHPARPAAAALAAPLPEPEPPAPLYITAPRVGIFHRAARPEDRPFVVEGDEVVPGQIVGSIEAMRIQNPVEATEAGIVARFLVDEGQPVEYGQPLIELRRPGG